MLLHLLANNLPLEVDYANTLDQGMFRYISNMFKICGVQKLFVSVSLLLFSIEFAQLISFFMFTSLCVYFRNLTPIKKRKSFTIGHK